MADIVLCRIDSRLIHGQVMTKWVNQSSANKIVVVSDELAADESCFRFICFPVLQELR